MAKSNLEDKAKIAVIMFVISTCLFMYAITLVLVDFYFPDKGQQDADPEFGVCTEVRYIDSEYREEKMNAYLQHGFYVPFFSNWGSEWEVHRDVPCDEYGNPDPSDYTEPDIVEFETLLDDNWVRHREAIIRMRND